MYMCMYVYYIDFLLIQSYAFSFPPWFDTFPTFWPCPCFCVCGHSLSCFAQELIPALWSSPTRLSMRSWKSSTKRWAPTQLLHTCRLMPYACLEHFGYVHIQCTMYNVGAIWAQGSTLLLTVLCVVILLFMYCYMSLHLVGVSPWSGLAALA